MKIKQQNMKKPKKAVNNTEETMNYLKKEVESTYIRRIAFECIKYRKPTANGGKKRSKNIVQLFGEEKTGNM